MNNPYISKLLLSNFRNHKTLSLSLENKSVVIHGKNGSGKTSILEGISLLSAGKGLRGADLNEVTNVDTQQNWSVYADVVSGESLDSIGTGLEITTDGKAKRILMINDKVSTQTLLSDKLNIIWLTPQMNHLFVDSASTRRKFFDRIVYSIDKKHSARINNYDKALRERIAILIARQDEKWLSIVENKIADLGVEISNMRRKTVTLLNQAISEHCNAFPKAEISLTVDINSKEEYLQGLFNSRKTDRERQRNSFGVHKCDMSVVYCENGKEAKLCSTGEQKSLLISIILGRANMHKLEEGGIPSILLLDEVSSYLDSEKEVIYLKSLIK